MFDKNEIFPIYGPPGTGKTTTCVEVVRKRIWEGVDPKHIAYVGFTKKAAWEAQERVVTKLGIKKAHLPHFCTIHALSHRLYKALYKEHTDVMKKADFRAVGDKTALPVTGNHEVSNDPDSSILTTTMGIGKGDFCLAQINLAHARGIPLEAQIADYLDPFLMQNFKVTPREIQLFDYFLKEYKQVKGKIDFCDMLDRAHECEPLDVTHAIIDEAQDLSYAQWLVCERLLSNCSKIWIAGDDDQAIYEFSGADSSIFLNMGDHPNARVLDKTYRLPPAVFDHANRISARISKRVKKKWKPVKNKEEGGVRFINSLNEVADLFKEGEWLLLTRNRTYMKIFEDHMRVAGYRYMLDGKNSIPDRIKSAIVGWEHLRNGGTVPLKTVVRIYEAHRSSTLKDTEEQQARGRIARGHKTGIQVALLATEKEEFSLEYLQEYHGMLSTAEMPWYDVLLNIPESGVAYYRAAAKKGELRADPRIRINTIHGVKGGEADNVIVYPKMGTLTAATFMTDPDPEYRCAYVAVTRARQNLYILLSGTEADVLYM